jgi:hypothetical protein
VRHGAEAAIAGTDITQDKKRRGELLPTLADIGTVSLLTNGVEPLVLDESLQPEIVGASWRFDLQP